MGSKALIELTDEQRLFVFSDLMAASINSKLPRGTYTKLAENTAYLLSLFAEFGIRGSIERQQKKYCSLLRSKKVVVGRSPYQTRLSSMH